MYAIIDVIYGIPLTEEINDLINKWEADPNCDKWEEDEEHRMCGFEVMYSGHGGIPPGFCGVSLDQFDESNGHNSLINLKLEPTNDQKKKTLELINNLDREIKDIILPVGIYLIWSTS